MHAGTKVSNWPQNDPLEDYYYERAVNTLTFLFERMSLDDDANYFEQLPSSTFGDPIRGLPMWIAYRSRFRLKNLPSFASWPTIQSPIFPSLKTSTPSGAGQRAAHSWSRVSHCSINPYSSKGQRAQRPKGLIQGNQTSGTFFQPALEGSFVTNSSSATPTLPKRSQEPSRSKLDNHISSSEASITLSSDGNDKASKLLALLTADLSATAAASDLSVSPVREPDATAVKSPDATRTTSRAGPKKKKARKTSSKLTSEIPMSEITEQQSEIKSQEKEEEVKSLSSAPSTANLYVHASTPSVESSSSKSKTDPGRDTGSSVPPATVTSAQSSDSVLASMRPSAKNSLSTIQTGPAQDSDTSMTGVDAMLSTSSGISIPGLVVSSPSLVVSSSSLVVSSPGS
ncbi:hypothetical protein BG000_005837, partial [Podila horticola]